MTDLRQGVTEVTHEALDLLDQLRARGTAGTMGLEWLLAGESLLRQAMRAALLTDRRRLALGAVASIILAIEVDAADAKAAEAIG